MKKSKLKRIENLDFKKWAPIRPLPSAKSGKVKKIAVLDIEAENWTGFLVLGFYYLNRNYYKKYYTLREAMNDIFDYCIKYKIKDVFFHNGGKYDVNFVIDGCLRETKRFKFDSAIDRGSSLLMTKIIDVNSEFVINFRDSIGFIPMSLAKAGESYKVDVLKDSIDYKYLGYAFRNADYIELLFSDVYQTGKGAKLKRNEVKYDGKLIDSYSEYLKIYNKDPKKITYFCKETKSDYRIYNKDDVEEYLEKIVSL